jgi:acyl-CoA reductase-like NAD-dependent aldehyde dehydrogenase
MSDLPISPEIRVEGRVLIGGSWYEKDERFDSLNPANGEPIGSVPRCNRQDVEAAVLAASEAFPSWSNLPATRRFGYLDAVRGLLIQEGDALASLVTRENGKPLLESHAIDVGGSLDFLTGLLKGGEAYLEDATVRASNPALWGKRITVRRVPLGVVGIISPWNLPLAIPMGQIAVALAAGNTVVFKPSEFTPLVGVKIATLFHRAGFPAGVFNCVTGGKDTGQHLVESEVDGLLFTGSTAVGRKIQAQLGPRLIPTEMELGGKDAFLVLPDAPYERTVAGALWCGLFGSGQACSSSERYFVPRAWMPGFAQEVAVRAGALKVGDGMDETVQVGPLISGEQLERVQAQVDEAVARGARVLCGGGRRAGGGFFFEPTVLTEVPPDCSLMREETFGPVIPIIPYDDLEEAIGLCNGTHFGLSASVWTSDTRRGEEVARRLRVGTVWVNDSSFTHSQARCPWGGVKASGLGRTHWLGSLHELTTPQVVATDRGKSRGELWWYPYGAEGLELFRRVRLFSGEGVGGKLLHGILLVRALFQLKRTR